MVRVIHGSCEDVIESLIEDGVRVDSVVTDPPYGINFMGKKWDYDVPDTSVWCKVKDILKPGGHAVIACGTRTQHRMAVNIEDAGFEIRDVIGWVYATGMPKGQNVHKAINKRNSTVSSEWRGWGTTLKPALELWSLCRKPTDAKTVADNVLEHGTGALNIDGCRVPTKPRNPGNVNPTEISGRHGIYGIDNRRDRCITYSNRDVQKRYPSNIIHDGSEEVGDLFPDAAHGESASAFFYCAKASRSERDHGLGDSENRHPTVKPIRLMQYLCRLVTPAGGTVLDPFVGSGTTGIGAVLEGFNFIGIDVDSGYCELAKKRIRAHCGAFLCDIE